MIYLIKHKPTKDYISIKTNAKSLSIIKDANQVLGYTEEEAKQRLVLSFEKNLLADKDINNYAILQKKLEIERYNKSKPKINKPIAEQKPLQTTNTEINFSPKEEKLIKLGKGIEILSSCILAIINGNSYGNDLDEVLNLISGVKNLEKILFRA